MKHILNKILLLLAVVTCVACSKDDDAPQIDSVWKNMISEPIEKTEYAYPGQTICLHGSAFYDLRKVFVNGTDIDLTTSFIYDTENFITFQLPSDVKVSTSDQPCHHGSWRVGLSPLPGEAGFREARHQQLLHHPVDGRRHPDYHGTEPRRSYRGMVAVALWRPGILRTGSRCGAHCYQCQRDHPCRRNLCQGQMCYRHAEDQPCQWGTLYGESLFE